MNIIKLNTISSTNDFLKQLCNTQSVENFTVVTAENQTQGKGQRGNFWNVEPNKNLTFSILYKKNYPTENSVFDLNVAICVSIIEALQNFEISKLNIKWANDILLNEKKIAGVLIENTFSAERSVCSVIGIGLNVNQTNFNGFPQASSLKKIMQKEFNKEAVLLEIIQRIKENTGGFSTNKSEILWEKYHNYLFRKDVLSVFELPDQTKFMGIIKQVLRNGKLQILLEDESLKKFDLKKVRLIF